MFAWNSSGVFWTFHCLKNQCIHTKTFCCDKKIPWYFFGLDRNGPCGVIKLFVLGKHPESSELDQAHFHGTGKKFPCIPCVCKCVLVCLRVSVCVWVCLCVCLDRVKNIRTIEGVQENYPLLLFITWNCVLVVIWTAPWLVDPGAVVLSSPGSTPMSSKAFQLILGPFPAVGKNDWSFKIWQCESFAATHCRNIANIVVCLGTHAVWLSLLIAMKVLWWLQVCPLKLLGLDSFYFCRLFPRCSGCFEPRSMDDST